MAKNPSVVAFLDLLGTKASAKVGSEKYEEVLFHFYRSLVENLRIELSDDCKARVFGDSAYIFKEGFGLEFTKKLVQFRNIMFSHQRFFKCALVEGSFSETEATRIRTSKLDRSDVMSRFVHGWLNEWIEKQPDPESFWQKFSLSHYGASANRAYFMHEEFKGFGFCVSNELLSPSKRWFVRSAFPSNVSAKGYQTYYDLRYPKEVCRTIYFWGDDANRQNTTETIIRDGWEAAAELKIVGRVENPVSWEVFEPSSLTFVQGVIQSMRIASIRKREYATYYLPVLIAILNSSVFQFVHHSGNLDDEERTSKGADIDGDTEDDNDNDYSDYEKTAAAARNDCGGWSGFPEIFYEVFLRHGVLQELSKTESFDLFLVYALKHFARVSSNRQAIVDKHNAGPEEIFDEDSGLFFFQQIAENTTKQFLLLLHAKNDVADLLNGRYSSVLSEEERVFLQFALAEATSPYGIN